MTTLSLSLTFILFCSLFVAALYLFLFIREQEVALRTWAASWALYSLRFAVQLAMVHELLPASAVILQQSVSIAGGLLFLRGTEQFVGRKPSRIWPILAALALLWTVIAYHASSSFVVLHAPDAFYIAACFVFSGIRFAALTTVPAPTRIFTGVSLILWGLHKADYPFLRTVELFAPWGFMLASLLFLMSAVGIILVFYEKLRLSMQLATTKRVESESRFRSIVETTIDGVILASEKGMIIFTNSGAAAMFGYEPEELTGKPLSMLMPPRYRTEHARGIERLKKTNRSSYLGKSLSMHGLRKDGSEFPLDMNVSHWTSEGKTFFSGIVRDTTAIRAAEQKLASSNALLTSLIDSIPDLIFYKDMDGGYLGCNTAFAAFTGKGKKDIVGSTDFNLFPHEVADFFRKKDQEMLQNGKARRNEEWVTYPDGRRVLLDTLKTPYYAPDGTTLGLIGISRDITQRKEMEETLAANLSLFTAIIEGSTDAIFAKDRQGRYILANEATVKIIGADRKTIIGSRDDALFPKEIASQIGEADNRIMESGKAELFEETLATSAGLLIFLTAKTPLIDPSGQVSGIIGIARNITERVEQVRKIAEGKQLLHDVFVSIQDGISVLDANLNVVQVNPSMHRLFPALVPLEGKKCYEAYQHRDKPCPNCPSVRALESGRLESGEVPFVAPDGTAGTLELYAYPMKDETGAVTGIVEYLRDITDKKRQSEEKQKLEEQLRQSQKMEAIGTLAGGIAHDFNNILVPILCFTELLLAEEPQNSPKRIDLLEIFKASKRAKDLVKQILTFSRRTEHERAPMLISPIIKECIKLLRASIPTSIKITANIKTDRAVVLADPTHIHQIVMNLATNAYHAMKGLGTLTISLEEVEITLADMRKDDFLLFPGPYVLLRVSDTGCGMSPSVVNRIFEPYFTTKKQGEGTGLGLSVVHGIVKSYNGEITVRSASGVGSSFSVYLPLHQQATMAAPELEENNLPRGNGEHILLVDDEEALLKSVQRMLEDLGYHVTATTSSQDGLDLFKQAPDSYHLVITDQTMPGLTGDRLAVTLLEQRPELPIIICTGFSEVIDAGKAEMIGIRGFLAKPFSRKDLAETIHRLTNEKNA